MKNILYRSTGYRSTGDRSTGDWSTGDYSTGYRSTGDYSTGYYSTGYYSTGDWSTGDYSTGYYSTGDWSTGDYSTGDYSTGYRSTGDYSTGDWSISNHSTGHFSTIDYSGFGAFNKPCTPEEWRNAIKPSFIFFDLTEWIDEERMTEEEKQENPTYETTGGYLKVYDYKEAFQRSFHSLSEEEKKEQTKQLKALPNFDKDIFFEISGIYIDKKNKEYTLAELQEKLGENFIIKK